MSVTSELELLIEKVRTIEQALIARTRDLVNAEQALLDAQDEIARLKAAVSPVSPVSGFGLSLRPSTSTVDAAWKIDCSDSRNTITKLIDRWRCKAGGYSGASAVFARWRAFLPEAHNFAARKAFTLGCTWDIGQTIMEYVRILGTDNYLGKMKSSGASVGTRSGDEWRVMLVYYSDGSLRLMSVHQNHAELLLWQSPGRLPLGRHTALVEFAPSVTNLGSWKLTLDGQVFSKTGVQTVPSTVPTAERVVTRLVAGADGCNKWTALPVAVDVLAVDFTAVV